MQMGSWAVIFVGKSRARLRPGGPAEPAFQKQGHSLTFQCFHWIETKNQIQGLREQRPQVAPWAGWELVPHRYSFTLGK